MGIFRPQGLISPLIAAGDIWTYDGSANSRLALGTRGKQLFSGATDIEWDWESRPGVYNTTTSLLLRHNLILASGTITLTLPDASTSQGKVFQIRHSGVSLTDVVTITRFNAPDSIAVNSTTVNSINLYTNGETIFFANEGGVWYAYGHIASTIPVSFSPTITGITSNPTKADSGAITATWSREGCYLLYNYNYIQTATTGAAAGSGGYLHSLPTGAVADTANIIDSTADNNEGIYGHCSGFGTVGFHGMVKVYDANNVVMRAMNISANLGYVGSAFGAYTAGASVVHSFYAKIKIANWLP